MKKSDHKIGRIISFSSGIDGQEVRAKIINLNHDGKTFVAQYGMYCDEITCIFGDAYRYRLIERRDPNRMRRKRERRGQEQ